MIKNNFSFSKKLILIFLFLFAAGCATSPQKLGIPDKDWQKYNETEQKELLESYKQISEANAKEDAVTAAKYYGKDSSYNGPYLTVKVSGGEALLPPFADWQSYKPVSFKVYPNSCMSVLLEQNRASENTKKSGAFLRACYKDSIFFIDPSLYEFDKREGTLRITYSPLWEQGFSYHGAYTNGYIKLKNATVYIKNRHE
jgi:hypothetical protein